MKISEQRVCVCLEYTLRVASLAEQVWEARESCRKGRDGQLECVTEWEWRERADG